MGFWKKLIFSGSNADLNNLNVTNAVTASYFIGDGSALTNLVQSTTSQRGIVELATSTEVSTGTDADRAVTAFSLSNSVFGVKSVAILVTDPNGSSISTGNGKAYFRVDPYINGMNLIAVGAALSTASSSGVPTFQIRRVRGGASADMLSTALTIDANEVDSATATTAAVIDTANDDVQTGDQINIDIDVAGTGAKGLCITLTFRLP